MNQAMSQTVPSGLATRDNSPPRPRQKYGAACEECRRRKLRCDRRRPQCGVCQASGMQCQVALSRALRGPKPGYIKDLQARIGEHSSFTCDRITGEQNGVPGVTTPRY